MQASPLDSDDVFIAQPLLPVKGMPAEGMWQCAGVGDDWRGLAG